MATVTFAFAQNRPEPYRWRSVPIVGAGFVDGLVFHPTAKDVRYARTDMGGAYRWDAHRREWSPLLDWLSYPDLNLMGVESIAVDPHDQNRVYLACGTYTNPETPDGAILRSTDRGRTFRRTNVPFKFGGNENGRGNGERMMVDPNDGRVLILGTRNAGLWRSSDSGATWQRVDSFPWPSPAPRFSAGIIATLFDPATGKKGQPTPAVYAACSLAGQPNLFRSLDGGLTWSVVPGQPTSEMPTHMVRGEDGAIWITYGSSPGPSRMVSGSVWKFEPASGAWSNVTPDRPSAERMFGYAAVSVQRSNPNVAIVSSFFRPDAEQIFRTVDGGKTWRLIIGGRETYDTRIAPFTQHTGIHWLFDIEIDPRDPNHALFTTGYGGHETFNLTDADRGKPVRWQLLSKGIEESVGLDLVSPPKGAHLLSGIGDYGGYAHWRLDRVPEDTFLSPRLGNTNGIAVGEQRPNVVVRVGRAAGRGEANIGYSLDYGRTWQVPKSTPPNASVGRIAVSSDGERWVWSQIRGAFVTKDRGENWQACQGLPANLRVVADRSRPLRFYALDIVAGLVYVSEDGGVTFAPRPFNLTTPLPRSLRGRGDDRGGQDQLYVTPGRKDDFWFAAFDGLHHATSDAFSFTRIPGVRELHAFGFGKGAPGASVPSLFVVGVVNGERGFFRSDNFGQTWVRINDDQHQWGLVLQITGDPKVHGRVYVGTHGRGIVVGDPTPSR